MRISIIAAVAKNFAIGYDNQLIYHLPNDLKRFKKLTTGNTIIMGRRTFESLPKGALPNRRNIVLSSQANTLEFPGADAFKNLQEAIFDCQLRCEEGDSSACEVFIIGGASVYQEAIDIADRLCLTLMILLHWPTHSSHLSMIPFGRKHSAKTMMLMRNIPFHTPL